MIGASGSSSIICSLCWFVGAPATVHAKLAPWTCTKRSGCRRGAIVAAVGGGGKTSLVYALGRESAERGLAAIVTTTTRFTRPPGGQTPMIIETTEDRLAADVGVALRPGEALVAISGHGEHGRMHGFNAETISGLAALQPGLIAVEADGSAHRPFKAPAPHEPVIPPCTTDVIVCVGLAVLGHNLDDVWVHRSELASELADVPMGSPVTANTVVRVLLHPEGGRKGVPPGARVHALLNNPASPEHEQLAVHIGQRLVYGGFCRVVVASAHVPGDVRAVLA